MVMSWRPKQLFVAVLVIGSLINSGCTTLQTEDPVLAGLVEARKATRTSPTLVITDFTNALRCMDRQFSEYGIKDMHLVVEDLNDKSSNVSANATNLFVNAVLQMNARSEAISVRAVGDEAKSTAAARAISVRNTLLGQTQSDFLIRGSISQFDGSGSNKNPDQRAGSAEAKTGSQGAGAAPLAAGREFSLDLSVLRAADLGLVPGATARNSVLLIAADKGLDAAAGFKKLGINFLSNVSRTEANSLALRNLVELSSMELAGKLARIPYWRCLEIPNETEAVKTEIGSWHESMWANGSTEVVAYYQQQLNTLGILPKFERGKADENFKFALQIYRKALGLPASDTPNLDLFRAHLTTDRAKLWKVIEPLFAAESKERLTVKVEAIEPAPYKRGQVVNLRVAANIPSYTWCFIQDEDNNVYRLWTSVPAPRVTPDTPPAVMALPRGLLKADNKERPMQVTCLSTRDDVSKSSAASTPLGQLVLTGSNLQRISVVKSMRDVIAVFQSTGQEVAGDTLFIKAN
jgi:hypothetical protein